MYEVSLSPPKCLHFTTHRTNGDEPSIKVIAIHGLVFLIYALEKLENYFQIDLITSSLYLTILHDIV